MAVASNPYLGSPGGRAMPPQLGQGPVYDFSNDPRTAPPPGASMVPVPRATNPQFYQGLNFDGTTALGAPHVSSVTPPDQLGLGQEQAPGADPMAAYLAQFNASLAQSRSGIDTQLKQALGELGQRRDAASKVVAGLPAALQQSFAAGSQGLGNAATAGQGALSQDVRGTVGALQAPLQAALAQDKAGGNAMSPFLTLANMANYQGGEAMLNQQAMSGKQALDERQQQFLEQMALQDASHKQANDDYYNHLNYAHQLQAQDALDKNNLVRDQGIYDTSGGNLKSQADLAQIEQSPAYRYAEQAMTTGLYNNEEPPGGPLGDAAAQYGSKSGALQKQTWQDIADKYKGNAPLLWALYTNNKIPFDALVRAGIQTTPPASSAAGKSTAR